jgi:hypothetical protein
MVGAAGQSIWARYVEALGHPEWCEVREWSAAR